MKARPVAVVLIAVAVAAGAVWLYNWVLGDTETASGPIIAPTLPVATTVVAVSPPATLAADPTPASSVPPTAPTQPLTENPASAPAGTLLFQVSQDESEVRFTIYETLRGSPKDVVGVSSQVAGEAAVDPADLSTVQLGEIVINARTLATDDDRRNQAIRNRILFTDQYEFITFKPTAITGLSGVAVPGQAYSFQISGDLTIRDITQPVVFDVSLTAESTSRLVGTAKAVIQLAAFGLVVPSVPFVADVGEDVTLEIDFVLLAAQ